MATLIRPIALTGKNALVAGHEEGGRTRGGTPRSTRHQRPSLSLSLCIGRKRGEPVEAMCHLCEGHQQEEGQHRTQMDRKK